MSYCVTCLQCAPLGITSAFRRAHAAPVAALLRICTRCLLRNGLGLLGCPPYQVPQLPSGSRVNCAASVKTVTISVNGGLRSALHLPLVLPARSLMHEGLPRYSSVHPARVAATALASLALHSGRCGVYAVRIQFVVRVWPRNDLRCSAVNRETF